MGYRVSTLLVRSTGLLSVAFDALSAPLAAAAKPKEQCEGGDEATNNASNNSADDSRRRARFGRLDCIW